MTDRILDISDRPARLTARGGLLVIDFGKPWGEERGDDEVKPTTEQEPHHPPAPSSTKEGSHSPLPARSLQEFRKKPVVRLIESAIEKARQARDNLVQPVGGIAPEDGARRHSLHQVVQIPMEHKTGNQRVK